MRVMSLATVVLLLMPGLVPCGVALAGGVSHAGETVDPWGLWNGSTTLRGANIYQRQVYPELDGDEFMGQGPYGPPYIQDDFDALAALGANYVNISCPGIFSQDPPYGLDAASEANLDVLLQMAAAADLFAVISFRSGPGRAEFSICCYGDDWYDPEVYLDDSVWTVQEAQDAWVAMWRSTAARYKDNPVVVGFDLMVEPNANELLFDEWDPEAFYAAHGNTLADWNQLYPRIVEAIREVDGTTPILVQPMGYSAVDWLPFMRVIDDARTIYAVHQYAPHVYTHQEPPLTLTYPGVFDADYDGNPDTVDRDWLDGLLATVDQFTSDHGVFVAVNEMGLMRWEPGAAQYLSDEIALFEQRGLNWAVWAWEPSWPPWSAEVTAFNFRFGPDPADHEDVPGNPLETVLTGAWAGNAVRPSNQAGAPLFVPAAANLPGLNGTRWRTDLEFKAAGAGGATVLVALLERDANNENPQTRTLTLEAKQALRLENVLEGLFGFEGAAALRVTPLVGTVLATSRTFTGTPSSGTFGQFVPVIAASEATVFGQTAELIQLSGIPGTPGFRTNIGLLNVTSVPVEVTIELHATDGALLGTLPVALRPLEYRQLGEVLEGLGQGEINDAYAVLATTTAGGSFLAYASVVDNASGDAILLPAITVNGE